MSKKLIISKTVIFILIVGFIILFKSIFGEENTLVGVTTVTAMLMFLERDLTLSPLKNMFRLIALNLFIGIGSIIASSNMYIGIVVNLTVLFTISYFLCYNLRKPMYLPFTLQYLFLISTPIDNSQIFMRLSSLFFGAIFIMATQMLANKNRIYKSGNKILIQICDDILEKLENIRLNEDNTQLNLDIISLIGNFRNMVHDKRESDFYLTEEARIKLNLSIALENLNILLNETKEDEDLNYILNKVPLFIKETKEILENKDSSNNVSHNIKELIDECERKRIKSLHALQVLESMIFLLGTIDELVNLEKQNYNIVKKLGEIPGEFRNNNFKNIISSNKSLKTCYAIRLSIATTIGIFITDYFKLTEGRWIVFTIFSLVNPLYEVSKSKTLDRIISTIIGSVIVVILFNIFKDITIRTLILMLAGYIGSYTTKYRYNMICVTVSALGAAAIIGNTQVLTLSRIIFVILGAVIAIIANKFILSYNLEDSNKEFNNLYNNVLGMMIKEVYRAIGGCKETNTMKNLIITASLIENKFRMNQQIINDKNDLEILKSRRMLVGQIYELYIWIIKEKIDKDHLKYIVNDIKKIIDYEYNGVDIDLDNIVSQIKMCENINTKIALSSIFIIVKELNQLNKLKHKAQI